VLILGLHPSFITQKGDSPDAIWDLLTASGYQVKKEGKNISKMDFCNCTLFFDVHCIAS
jgi:hypothetical protein